MPRQRVDLVEVTVTALTIVDRESFGALSLTAVAGELGVRPSALYTYFANLDALRHAVAVQAIRNLTERLRDAAVGRAGGDAIAAMAHTYRRFAADHPGQFVAALAPPPADHDDLVLASESLTEVFVRVIAGHRGDGGRSSDEAIDGARAARSAIHGFVALEVADLLGPVDRDASFEHLVGTVIRLLD